MLWRISMLGVILGLMAGVAEAQLKVAVVNFERAVVESAQGQQAVEEFNAIYEERTREIETRQQEIAELQNRLQTQGRALSETASADLTRDIERKQTDLNRLSEDIQRDLQTLQENLLRPIADVARRILSEYAAENAFTIILDVSNPQTNIVYASAEADITTELIRQIDAEMAAAQSPPSANQ